MRNAFRLSLLACGLLLLCVREMPAETAAQFLEQGVAAFERGEPSDAIKRLKSALENGLQGDDLVAARGKLADAYLHIGDAEKAMEACNEAIRLAPTKGELMALRGRILAARGESGLAIKDYDEALRLNPKDAVALHERGGLTLRKGDWAAAIRDFDESLKLDPKATGVYNDRGMAYLRQGKPVPALDDFNEAIRLQPQNILARRNRAAFNIARKNWDAALEDLDAVIELNPTSEDCRVRAFIYQSRGEKELADFDLETATKLDPDNAKVWYDRAANQANDGQWATAIADLTRASELDPKNVDYLHLLARLLATCPEAAQRNGKKAVETALRACELTEWKTAPSVDILAAAYARAGDFDAAMKFGKMALTLEGIAEGERPRMERRLDYYRAHMAFVLNWKP